MNSRQYAKMMEKACKDALTRAGIIEYTSVCLRIANKLRII